jgi:aspartate racemase
LFAAATIIRMTGHLETLLADVAADPDKRLSDVSVLTEAERHQVLVEWNDTRRPYPRDACIQQLFEAQVEVRPDKVAVIEGEVRLTYRELNRRSNQVAHYLRELGVGPNQSVAVCIGRSADFVVALLGILKAGGVYVPLDPDYPSQRLRFMLDDSRAAAVVTCEDWLAGLSIEGLPVVRLDADAPAIADQPDHNPDNRNTATDLAYVIYTSGSTGRPKGVEVPHRGVVRLLFSSGYAPLDANQIILLLAPTSFDASTFELWGALLHGGTCVVYPQRVPDARELEEALTGSGITCLWLTAALFNTVMDQRPQALASVPHLMIGGEALSVRHVRRGLELLPQTQMVNGYGPTESTTFTCTYPIPRDLDPAARSVPIGRPIGNTRVYIVDRYLNPVPVGVYGDFYIAGDGLARGYLDRPALTAERFVTDPFSDDPEDRMYKTGDVCRWLPDGTIEFFGRLDHQVKIRGFRIELGEIEAVLGQHAAVHETVVLAREDDPGDRRLVAYIVSHADPPPENQALRDFLKERLPEYMVPSAFVRLEALPLTPIGKVDTQALPAPDAVRPDLEQTFVAPRDTLEYQLTKVWEKTLGIETVGVQDNFFELGGHSLMAVRVLSQVEEMAHKKLPLVTLFQAPTVEQLAGVLRQSTWEAPWSSLVAIQPSGSKPPFFCVHAAAGNVLFYSDLARYLGTDQPLYGLQARGLDGSEAPVGRLEEMAAHHVDEIRSIQPEGPYFLGGLSFGGTVAFEMAQQLTAQGHEVALLVLFDTCGPGYPQISFPRAIRDKMIHLGRRFRHNISSFQHKQGQEKGAFALQKVRNVTARSRRRNEKRLDRIREKGERVAYKLYQMSGRPLPPVLRHHAVREADLEAGRIYAHHPYPGRITLFRASNQPAGCRPDPMMGWGDLAVGGMEIHEIPGAHSQHLIREPKIQIVIDKLRACLNEAQETAARKQG